MQMIAEFKRRLMDVPQPLVDGLEKVYVLFGLLELGTNGQLPRKRQPIDGLGLCSSSECRLESSQKSEQPTNANSTAGGNAAIAESTNAESNGFSI
jgi:hypothetical protein